MPLHVPPMALPNVIPRHLIPTLLLSLLRPVSTLRLFLPWIQSLNRVSSGLDILLSLDEIVGRRCFRQLV